MTKSKWIVLGVLCAQVLLCVVVCKAMLPSGSGGAANQAPDASVPPPNLHMLGASQGPVGPFVPPLSWSQATWFVDPTNTSGCASDNNLTCSLSTCGTSGDGPCLTFGSIVSRWGTNSPQLRQATIVNYMSQPALSGTIDPINVSPIPATPDAQLGFVCALGAAQQTGTGTITVVNSKVRTKGSSTLLTVTYPAGAAVGNLAVNSTHSSRAWVYAASGGNFTTSQPIAPVTASRGYNQPGGFGVFNEVDTWATSDTVTTYAPISLPLITFLPSQYFSSNGSSSPLNSGYVYQCGIKTPSTLSGGVALNDNVFVFESSSNVTIAWTAEAFQAQGILAVNMFTSSLVETIGSPIKLKPVNFVGGVAHFANFNNTAFAGDVIVAAVSHVFQGYIGGTNVTVSGGTDGAYLDAAATLNYDGNGGQVGFVGAGVLWGPGTLNVTDSAKMVYPTGATGATNFFLQTGLQLNGGTTFLCVNNINDSAAPTCALTLSAANLDSSGGATSSCTFRPGGASLCNYGP
jgi:hypothetical protein